MTPLTILLLSLLPTTSLAALNRRSVSIPAHVKLLQTPSPTDTITLQLSLHFSSLSTLESELRRFSDPDSQDYGNWLSASDVTSLFQPPAEANAGVAAWLEEHGVTEYHDGGMYINFATTIKNANEMLDAEFLFYEVDGVTKLRTRTYAVPEAVEEWVELVSPTTYFGIARPIMPVEFGASADVVPGGTVERRREGVEEEKKTKTTRAEQAENCYTLMTPYCLEQFYGYGNYNASFDSGSTVSFASFLNQSARDEDLGKYLEHFNLTDNPLTTEVINGGLDHQDKFGGNIEEANLDAQFLAAVVKNLSMTQYIVGGTPPYLPNVELWDDAMNSNEPYLEFYDDLMARGDDEVAKVISISYDDDEQTVPMEYAVRVCNMMGMMGLRGITILHASGDLGVGASCQSSDGEARPEFTPQFPGTCPYVTTVGGTQFQEPEVAWVAAGGGFSNYFPVPWYQLDAQSRYVNDHVSEEVRDYYSAYTNFSGRGFPDLAAHSASPAYLYYSGGSVGYAGGTSAATPVVAGMIGLLNDARLREGLPVMGFINPWLYANAGEVLVDVTEGTVEGCTGMNYQTGLPVEGASVIPYVSWNGTEGWDPASGLGVPRWDGMLEVAMGVVAGGGGRG